MIAENLELVEPVNKEGIRATFQNEKYGRHPRNNFDIWMADSIEPTPLVIYIHGGGFIGGDKSKYYSSDDMVRFLRSGVSVAVINYRFMNEAPYGILASLNDSKRCLQYIRYNAKKYNIDKNRVACSGGSAGAGTSLWLAFSVDMAEPESENPVLRESTRITCAGAFATQSTYDICRWDKIIGLPKDNSPEKMLEIAQAFGFNSADYIKTPEAEVVRKELDFLEKMNKNASPFFVFNKQAGGAPMNQDELNHHPNHAMALLERAKEVEAEAIVYAPEIGIVDPSGKDLVDFFLGKFNLEEK
ncbi:alpha/beta hydrolase fold domain-containing protein [Maribellus comscasis]|uniref:Alpha/beta hydrolase fold domain-containing protein n=1 Tax=Maribellus comscasis TaxID=2681766 RepID=A0A6I6JS55_9BACT|nr:alpha/beta hydrolase fold domain-containing protein [Maribellus comscasis]QGY45271.1 alpha/beta hydrolase fold domain-containing protein [Maribellus comscasis]